MTYEARGAGCVVLASTACGACGQSGEGLLLHQPGDVDTLSRQLESLAYDRSKYLHIREKGQILSKSLTGSRRDGIWLAPTKISWKIEASAWRVPAYKDALLSSNPQAIARQLPI